MIKKFGSSVATHFLFSLANSAAHYCPAVQHQRPKPITYLYNLCHLCLSLVNFWRDNKVLNILLKQPGWPSRGTSWPQDFYLMPPEAFCNIGPKSGLLQDRIHQQGLSISIIPNWICTERSKRSCHSEWRPGRNGCLIMILR